MNRTQNILAAGTLTLIVLACIVIFGVISSSNIISTVLAQSPQQPSQPQPVLTTPLPSGNDVQIVESPLYGNAGYTDEEYGEHEGYDD
jgi:hypothetical protein